MAAFAILMLSAALALMAVHLVSLGLAMPRLRAGAQVVPVAPAPPRITLLRPFKGLEYRLEETLGSSLMLDYPDTQVLFCVDEADDPAVPLVRRLIAAHPNVDAQLLIGRDPVSHNPKINNLMKGWRAADGAFVAMADSNIILPPDYLSQLLSRWDAGTGLVTSPAAGVDPESFGAALECAFLNGYQARWQVAADQLGLGYAQGKTLFWKRAFLDAAGGPAVLGSAIAEDAASTKLVRAAGLRVHLARRPFAQPVGRRSAATVWKRQLRWAIIRRVAFPGLFLAEPLTSAAVPLLLFALGTVAGGLPAPLIIAFAVLWYGAEWGLLRMAGWPAGAEIIAASLMRDGCLATLAVILRRFRTTLLPTQPLELQPLFLTAMRARQEEPALIAGLVFPFDPAQPPDRWCRDQEHLAPMGEGQRPGFGQRDGITFLVSGGRIGVDLVEEDVARRGGP